MKPIAGIVSEVRRETAQAVTIRVRLDDASFSYRPGQYVTIDPRQFAGLAVRLKERETARGKREGPGYFSLASDAGEAGVVEVTVKDGSPARPSLLVSYLSQEVRVGDRVSLSGPGGVYCLPAEPPAGVTGFLHLCAGSGVAPNRGMIRHALAKGWPQRHLLILQDRTAADVLYREEWEDLLRKHPGQLRCRIAYSGAGEYVDRTLLTAAMAGYLEPAAAQAFVCGPNAPRDGRPGFRDRWAGELASLGFSHDRILIERG